MGEEEKNKARLEFWLKIAEVFSFMILTMAILAINVTSIAAQVFKVDFASLITLTNILILAAFAVIIICVAYAFYFYTKL